VQRVSRGGAKIFTIASGLNPAGLAVRNAVVKGVPVEQILFTNTPSNVSTVEAVSPTGGALTPLDSTTGIPKGIASDASNVYFTDWELGTVNAVGASFPAPVVLAAGPGVGDGFVGPTDIAVDAINVYWIVDNRPPPGIFTPGDGAVMRVSLAGGAAATLATIVSGGTAFAGDLGPTGMAIDGTNVYYATYHNDTTGVRIGTLWEMPLGGGTPVAIGRSTAGRTAAVALDAASVYWVAGGSVLKSVK
jgi:hypothetical protein